MRRAFTLIEIMVVLAIIGLLAAILFPVFATARAMARRTSCVSQLRQIGMGFAMYGQDNDDLLPEHLTVVYPSYVNDANLFICPNDPLSGQRTGNDYLEGTSYLTTGVSYEYYPQWLDAQTNGWYNTWPNFGAGEWDDMTPLAGCVWHWAKTWNSTQDSNAPGSKGWEIMLTRGGSVRKIRVEGIEEFTPGMYQ